MSGYKGQRKSGFLLPEPIVPEATWCVQFQMPAALEYRRALITMLYTLTKWVAWEKTELGDTRAKEAAELWRVLLMSTLTIGDDCGANLMFKLRQNDENHCLLEQSLDGGETWENAFNYRLCLGATPRYRFDAYGNMEVSYDGGETWQEATSTDDPRIEPPMYPPLPGGDSDTKRCLAARNAAGNLKQEVDKTIADANAWGGITGLTAALLSLLFLALAIGSAGTLTPLLLTAAAALLSGGAAAMDSAYTEEVWDTILCIFYCNFGTDGNVDDAGLTAIKAEIEYQLDGVASFHTINMLNLIGADGLTNLARLAQNEFTEDCSVCGSCGCDGCDPMAASGWTQTLFNATTNAAAFSGGTSFHAYGTYGTCYGCDVEFTIDLGTTRCIGGIRLFAGGSSVRNWLSGFEVYVDGQYYGQKGTIATPFEAGVPFLGEPGRIIPVNKKRGRYLTFKALLPYTGNSGNNEGFAIKQVTVRHCNEE